MRIWVFLVFAAVLNLVSVFVFSISYVSFGYFFHFQDRAWASPVGAWEQVWTTWSSWSDCSKSCDVGVRHRYRECVGYDGVQAFRINDPQCEGHKKEVSTCQTQECAAGARDFYTEQCRLKNQELVYGQHHHWIPYDGESRVAKVTHASS